MRDKAENALCGLGRERIATERQRAYWNALSAEYGRTIRIRTDDFHYGPQIPGEKKLGLLPPVPPRRGATALELGCGGAQNSCWLARRGWRCTASDASEAQLGRAAGIARRLRADVEFLHAPIEAFPEAVGRRKFDFVHSSHALEFVEDPEAAIRAMAQCARKGGLVMVSTVHPLFNGLWIEGEFEDENGADAGGAGAGLFLRNYFSPPDDIRDDANGHAVSRAWPVSAWFEWFRAAGLSVERLLEPPADPRAPYTSDDWADHGGQLDCIPSTLILLGRKNGGV